MKLNKIALAVVAAALMPVAANAGVTVTPLLLGYHYVDGISKTEDKQGEQFADTHQDNDLYTGAGIGIELTPTIALELEYGETDSDALQANGDKVTGLNAHDFEQKSYSGNFTIGTETFSGYTNSPFKPYVLIGAGQSKTSMVFDDGRKETSKDTIGNLGLGTYYRINDALSLRGEGRAIYNFDNDWWEGLALAGLNVVLGGHLAPAAPVVEPNPIEPIVLTDGDDDQDGVLNSVDKCPGTPLNVVVDADGCPREIPVDDALRMELRVFFDNDKTVIKDQYKPEIQKVAEKMSEYPNSTASIEGHASKTGPSARYNQRLSEARANAVKSMLVNQFGVAPQRISTVGYGYDRPIADNNTAEGRAMNRRVYAIITGNKSSTTVQTKEMNVQ